MLHLVSLWNYNLPKAFYGAHMEIQKVKSTHKLAALMVVLPLVFMMIGTAEENSSSMQNLNPTATESKPLPGNLNGPCRGDFGGFCVPVGSCPQEDKVLASRESCDAGFECCTKELNMSLCASRGGECGDVGRCGEGVALFREAEDCNRAKHGKDCCIWM